MSSLRTCVCAMLVGVMLTVLSSWASAYWGSRTSAAFEDIPLRWPDRPLHDWPPRPTRCSRLAYWHQELVYACWQRTNFSDAEPDRSMLCGRFGFPFRSMKWTLRGVDLTPRAGYRRSKWAVYHEGLGLARADRFGFPFRLPLAPSFAGFVGNSCVYAAIILTPIYMIRYQVIAARRRRHACPRCGYCMLNVPQSARCPECGARG